MSAIMIAVVGLAFLFGFGNVWTLALRLGVPAWVAPLVAPAVDLSVIGLLLGTRYLALYGGRPEQLRPARRLLVFSSLITLALNVADPLITGHLGRAAFDTVGPLLLIGWAEVGPGLLQAISAVQAEQVFRWPPERYEARSDNRPANRPLIGADEGGSPTDDLLDRARLEDARHWAEHQRPISAETLGRRLHVGAARSPLLVAAIRSTGPDR